MAKNEVSSIGEGRYLTVAKASVSSGDPVLIGDQGLHGVALIDTNDAGNITMDTQGIYALSVKGVDDAGNAAIAVGDPVAYTDGDTPKLNAKQSGSFFGYALEVVGSGLTATIKVLVVPFSRIKGVTQSYSTDVTGIDIKNGIVVSVTGS